MYINIGVNRGSKNLECYFRHYLPGIETGCTASLFPDSNSPISPLSLMELP